MYLLTLESLVYLLCTRDILDMALYWNLGDTELALFENIN